MYCIMYCTGENYFQKIMIFSSSKNMDTFTRNECAVNMRNLLKKDKQPLSLSLFVYCSLFMRAKEFSHLHKAQNGALEYIWQTCKMFLLSFQKSINLDNILRAE